MKKLKIIALILFGVMATSNITVFSAVNGLDLQQKMEKAFLWVDANASPLGAPSSVASDYFVMAMSGANRTFDYGNYTQIIESKEAETVSDAQRMIMALNASDGKMDNELVKVNTYESELSTVNELAGAILALASGKYKIDSDYIDFNEIAAILLTKQKSDGSFDSDVLSTSKAIIALSFFRGKSFLLNGEHRSETYHFDVNSSILRAVEYLKSMKGEDCGYGSILNTSFVIMALDSVGFDCDSDPGFVLGNQSTLTSLLGLQKEDGSFGETADDTAMALCAIVSHLRAMEGKRFLFAFDKSDKYENISSFSDGFNVSGKSPLTVLSEQDVIEVNLADKPRYEDYNKDEEKEPRQIRLKRGIKKDSEDNERSFLAVCVAIASVLVVVAVIALFILYLTGRLPVKRRRDKISSR